MTAPASTVGGPGGLRNQASWILVDQVISSATNAALSIIIARSVGAAEFGAFSIAFLVFSFLVGLCRALVTDPLIVRFSSADAPDLARAGRDAAGSSLLIGVVAGLVCAGAASAFGGSVGAALIALALVLPGLLLQDAWRQYFFAARRPRSAALNDGVWALVQLLLLAAVVLAGMDTVFWLTVAWGAAAGVAGLVGIVQAGGVPHIRSGWSWLQAHRDLSGHLAAGYTVNMGAVHVTMTLVGAIGGLAAVGAIRAAQVLLGPLQVLYPGLRAFVLPMLSRRAATGTSRLMTPAVLVSAFAAVAAVGWVLVLLLLPQSWGEQLLGDSWELARAVLPAVGATTAIVGASVGGALVLKALAHGGRLLTMNLVQAPLIVGLGCLGAYLDGARGAALGLAVAHLAGFVVLWILVSRAVRVARARR